MRTKKVGILTLAISLISIGCLLLLRNFLNFDVGFVLSIFTPSVIILFGLELILSKLIFDNKKEEIKMKVDKLSLILLIIVVIVTSMGNLSLRVDGVNIFGSDIFYEHSSFYTRNYDLDVKGKNKFIINNSHGDIDIRSTDKEKISINCDINIKHNDEEYVEGILDQIVEIKDLKEAIEVKTKGDRRFYDRKNIVGINVSYFIEIPKGIEVKVDNRYGDIYVEGINEVATIENGYGEIEIKNIGNKLNIINSYGDIEIENVKGNSKIVNEHGKVKAVNIDKNLEIETSYDNVEVAKINGDVYIKNGHDKIEVDDVRGSLTIDSEYCDIETSNIGKDADIEGSHGDMKLENIVGNVKIDSKYDEIYLSEAYKEINIMGLHSDIRVENSKEIKDYVKITTEYGDVDLRVSKEQKGEFILFSTDDEIDTNLDLTIEEEGRGEKVNEVITGGEGKFDIEARNGDIEIFTR